MTEPKVEDELVFITTYLSDRSENRPPAGVDCKHAPAKPVKLGPYFGESFGACTIRACLKKKLCGSMV